MTAACSNPTAPDDVARIRILDTGSIELDGKAVDLAQLDAHLQALKDRGGRVWYYRDNPAEEPPPNAVDVLTLVMRHELPVRMSSRPDFSDVVDTAGEAHVRTP